jgi:uncharacterized protein YecE (DUF72 family)
VALWIGTSGWSYPHWDRVLYPPGLRPADRLAVYTKAFRSVELNASFYRWPRDSSFRSWAQRLPDGFSMSVKAPRGLTHGAKLYRPERWVERIGRCWHDLGARRGVLLIQLPAGLARDDARLEYFLSCVPDWVRVAVEFRHHSWHADRVFALLERYGVGYCVISGAGLPCVLRATAPFVYIRLHGPDRDRLYAGSYSDADLGWWAARVAEWRTAERDVYAYFNNDGDGNAVYNARRLNELTAS